MVPKDKAIMAARGPDYSVADGNIIAIRYFIGLVSVVSLPVAHLNVETVCILNCGPEANVVALLFCCCCCCIFGVLFIRGWPIFNGILCLELGFEFKSDECVVIFQSYTDLTRAFDNRINYDWWWPMASNSSMRKLGECMLYAQWTKIELMWYFCVYVYLCWGSIVY